MPINRLSLMSYKQLKIIDGYVVKIGKSFRIRSTKGRVRYLPLLGSPDNLEHLTPVTKKNIGEIAGLFNISWRDLYITKQLQKTNSNHGATLAVKIAKSYIVAGFSDSGQEWVYVRRETWNPSAGQTKLYCNGKFYSSVGRILRDLKQGDEKIHEMVQQAMAKEDLEAWRNQFDPTPKVDKPTPPPDKFIKEGKIVGKVEGIFHWNHPLLWVVIFWIAVAIIAWALNGQK